MENRLLQFIRAENITQAQLADSIGMARASVSHTIAGRSKPSYEFLSSMLKTYPKLNAEWLLTGKGKMYKDSVETPLQIPSRQSEDDLFSYEYDTEGFEPVAVVEEPEPVQETAAGTPSPEIIKQSIASAIIPKVVEKQRNVKKIIILFDDGSYQEM